MSTKNKKSVASQALLEMDAITSAIKEESKNTLNTLLSEAVRNALRESCEEEEDKEYDIEEEDVDMKYVADSSKIVAVTYGQGQTAYKTFILNYNSYSVILKYNGQTYCLDAGEFITINHNA